MRYVIYQEGQQVGECADWAGACVIARDHAPATIQERRTGATPGNRRRTWIQLPENIKAGPTYMGGQDSLGE